MTSTTLIDFLSTPAAGDPAVERVGNGWRVKSPWKLVEFGVFHLRAGWWRLVCQGKDADLNGVELRLRASSDPLIIFSAAGSQGERVFLRAGSGYRISMLVSPWPGEARFEKLQLKRLSRLETMHLFVAGLVRVLGRDKPLARLRVVLQRLLAGQSFGVRTAPVAQASNANVAVEGHREENLRQTTKKRMEQRGEVLAVLDEDCSLHPRAWEIAGSLFDADAGLQGLFSDDCRAEQINLRTGWDPLLSASEAYRDAPAFFRVDKQRQDLPTLDQTAARHGDLSIRHVALPLAHGLLQHRRTFPEAPIPDLKSAPLISVILPTKFRVDLLTKCLSSLALRTDYPALEVIVVDNGSIDPQLPGVLAEYSDRLSLKTLRDERPFNFSGLINAGAAVANGQAYLALNDDIEAFEPGWLRRMASSAMEADVGPVGARLVYPDRSIQHAGVMMGLGGPCGHLWKGVSPEDAVRNPHICRPGQRVAVTGACMLVRRDLFERVGGYDEAFAVAFNDIDFCLKLRQLGYKTIYRGDAVLIHHESQSRGADDLSVSRRRRLAAEAAIFLSRWEAFTRDDPFASPAFDPFIEQGLPHRSLAGEITSLHSPPEKADA